MPPPDNSTDQGLLAAMRKGDASAFTALYRQHQAAVYRFALLWAGSRAVAADVTQDTFLHLMSNHNFDPARGSLAAYLCGVARNLVRRQLERAGSEQPLPTCADDEETAPGDAADHGAAALPLERILHRETVETVRKALLALPPHYRDVVVLIEMQELSYAETAAICGIEVGTVRSRLHRGREKLLQLLGPVRPATSVAAGGSTAPAASPAPQLRPAGRSFEPAALPTANGMSPKP